MRRTSTASSASGSAGARTPGDETSSTTHPLPARPDWAVGLKPQHPRHHDHSNPNSRTMSPARIGGQAHLAQQHATHPNLHSNDFPPLSSGPEKRQPVVGGAWTNATISRVMMPGPQGNVNPQGSALVHYPNSHTTPSPNATPNLRLDEQDHAFERPPPKGNSELFNPKAGPRSASTSTPNSVRTERDRFEVKEKEGKIRQKGEGMANAILVDKVGAMSLDDRGGEAECTAAEGVRPSPAISPSMGDPGSIGDAISS
ncbi:hypothetical protein A0H81_06142 [Grifola frondosa]|uniref:Uncharacterized protein n=1 Tax=Grifola frondosa TaxID=5627 RepID=A0A1C7MGQ2_GRIFR|nr:hypothetical protein A0H81_06142 [Grifola frondosa]